jgi:hypothetical protein
MTDIMEKKKYLSSMTCDSDGRGIIEKRGQKEHLHWGEHKNTQKRLFFVLKKFLVIDASASKYFETCQA